MISARVRFEVLKRDRFQCQYCGRAAPDVLLEVDHVLPVSAGGTDELENLRTSCQGCNRGKSDRLLAEGAVPVGAQAVEEVRVRTERLRSADEYQEARREYEAAMNERLDEFNLAWAKAFGGDYHAETNQFRTANGVDFPWESVVRTFIEKMGIGRVLDAVDLTRRQCRRAYGSNPAKYLSGILRKWNAADQEAS